MLLGYLWHDWPVLIARVALTMAIRQPYKASPSRLAFDGDDIAREDVIAGSGGIESAGAREVGRALSGLQHDVFMAPDHVDDYEAILA